MEDNELSIFYALLTITLWGTVAAISKLTLRDINPYQLMFYVSLFSTISLLSIIIIKKEFLFLKAFFTKNFKTIVLLGLIGLGLQQFFYFLALNYAPVAQVNVLNYMWPIFILVLSILILKQKFSWKYFLSLLLGFIGMIIVVTEGKFLTFNLNFILGYIFALSAAFAWALFSILNKLKKIEPLKGIFLFNLVGLCFMFIVMLVSNSSFLISSKSVLGTIYIGIFPTAIAFLTWLKSLKIGNPVVIANLAHLTPFISLLFIYIILKEKILFSEIIGLIVIVSAIFLQWINLKN